MRYSTVFLAIVASALAVQAQDFNAQNFGGRRGGNGRGGRFRGGNGGRFGQNNGQNNGGNGGQSSPSSGVANPSASPADNSDSQSQSQSSCPAPTTVTVTASAGGDNASAGGGAVSTDVANPQITAAPQNNVDFGNGGGNNNNNNNNNGQGQGQGQGQQGGNGQQPGNQNQGNQNGDQNQGGNNQGGNNQGGNNQDQGGNNQGGNNNGNNQGGNNQGGNNQGGNNQGGNNQGGNNQGGNNNGNNNGQVVDGTNGTPTTIGKMNNDGITEGLQQATSTDAGTAATSVAGAPDPVGQAQGNVQNVQALQGSLNLDPSQVMTNIQLDGNQTPADGQSASLTSKNNFINFCATKNLPLTNGEQVKTGSCNPVPMGVIVASDKMPSCKFTFPKNLDTIQSNQDFDIKLKINNFQAGNFVNAKANYFGAPAFTNDQGIIIGHSHVVIEAIESLTTTQVNDPLKFAFFKGINTPADGNGELSATVAGGLPAGTYKLSTINSAANHQPYLVAVAQHGSLDDAVYFSVSDNAGGNGGNNNNGQGNNNNNGQGNNQNGQGQGQGQNGQRVRRGALRRAHHF